MSAALERQNRSAPHGSASTDLPPPNGQGELAPRMDHDQVAGAFRQFLEALGLDLDDPNLTGTDKRVARAYEEILSGLQPASAPRISTFPNESGYTEMVTVTGIPFYSLCAHHFLPFFGTAHVGYLPDERLAGLSKLPRVVDHLARQPQLQERLTIQIAELLHKRLKSIGVIAVLDARHLCMEMRGVSRPGVTTRTCIVRGNLDATQRQGFLSGLHGTNGSTCLVNA